MNDTEPGCLVCAHHGWTGLSIRSHCRVCHREWSMATRATHCTRCHLHFTSHHAFDRHLRITRTVPPTSACIAPGDDDWTLELNASGVWTSQLQRGAGPR